MKPIAEEDNHVFAVLLVIKTSSPYTVNDYGKQKSVKSVSMLEQNSMDMYVYYQVLDSANMMQGNVLFCHKNFIGLMKYLSCVTVYFILFFWNNMRLSKVWKKFSFFFWKVPLISLNVNFCKHFPLLYLYIRGSVNRLRAVHGRTIWGCDYF